MPLTDSIQLINLTPYNYICSQYMTDIKTRWSPGNVINEKHQGLIK